MPPFGSWPRRAVISSFRPTPLSSPTMLSASWTAIPPFFDSQVDPLTKDENLGTLYSGVDSSAFLATLRACLEKTGFWEGEAPRRMDSPGSRPERLTLAAVHGLSETTYVGIIRDISELRRAEARLAYSENHDALTGLPNRLQYLAALEGLFDSRDAEARVASCVLDLDEFKRFNNDVTREGRRRPSFGRSRGGSPNRSGRQISSRGPEGTSSPSASSSTPAPSRMT